MKKEHYEKIIEELIKLIDEGVYIVDKQCIGRFYNDIMASMEKVNMDDVLGKRYQDAFPDVRTNDSTMMKALFNGEATVKQQQSYKNFYGKEVTTVNSTVPVIIDGETVAAIEVAKDITDIGALSVDLDFLCAYEFVQERLRQCLHGFREEFVESLTRVVMCDNESSHIFLSIKRQGGRLGVRS